MSDDNQLSAFGAEFWAAVSFSSVSAANKERWRLRREIDIREREIQELRAALDNLERSQ